MIRIRVPGPHHTWLLVAGLAIWLVATPSASAQEGSDPDELQTRFDRAALAMADGDYAAAATAFVALADAAPDSALADDALFTAAKLYEERLADPARARTLYTRLVDAYPDSRTALAARRRLDDLTAAIGPDHQGAQALARFTDILQHFTERGERESLTMAEAVLADYPDWPSRSRVLTWMGDVHQRGSRHRLALTRYLQAAKAAEAAGAEARAEAQVAAYRGAGEAALALGRFDAAEGYFRQMPVGADPSRIRSLEDALERVERARLRALLYVLSFAVIAVVVLLFIGLLRTAASTWHEALRAARTVPPEAVFMLPIAGILMAASLTAHYAIAPAVAVICIGGLTITWLSGIGLLAARARREGIGPWRPAVHALASVLAVIALTYIALHHNRLVDMIIETVRFGPDV